MRSVCLDSFAPVFFGLAGVVRTRSQRVAFLTGGARRNENVCEGWWGKKETVNRDARRFFYGKFETVCVIRFVSLGTAPPFRLSFFLFLSQAKTHTTENWTFSVRLFSALFFLLRYSFLRRARPGPCPSAHHPPPPNHIHLSVFLRPSPWDRSGGDIFLKKDPLDSLCVCARRFKPPPPPLSFSFFWQTAPECVCARVSLSVFFV